MATVGTRGGILEGIEVQTAHPVASESPDHLQPWGTARDNSRNVRFNQKLYRLYEQLGRPLRVLDLGCSGGGFVRDLINDGCIAVGLEGSDYSLRMNRAEWAVLGDKFLFTADITKPFVVQAAWKDGRQERLQFDVITAWEVLEHVTVDDVPRVCQNIVDHLSATGIAVFSISYGSDIINGVELHQTQQGKQWWTKQFRESGLEAVAHLEKWFNGQYVRGHKNGAPQSFHVVLSKSPASAPRGRHLSLRARALDAWLFSAPHRMLQVLVGIRTA